MATVFTAINKKIEFTAAMAATSLTAFGDTIIFQPGRQHALNVDVANAGEDLTDFALQLQEHPGATWKTYISGADWATASANLPYAASGLNTLADAASDNFHVKVGAAFAARFAASVASSTTDITVRCQVAFEA